MYQCQHRADNCRKCGVDKPHDEHSQSNGRQRRAWRKNKCRCPTLYSEVGDEERRNESYQKIIDRQARQQRKHVGAIVEKAKAAKHLKRKNGISHCGYGESLRKSAYIITNQPFD